VGPAVITSLTEVEERSLALESRAFSRPGRRHLLWSMPDSDGERAIRWLLVLALIAVAVARVADMQVPGLD
jgi:energy-coupling factor transport system permease protein